MNFAVETKSSSKKLWRTLREALAQTDILSLQISGFKTDIMKGTREG